MFHTPEQKVVVMHLFTLVAKRVKNQKEEVEEKSGEWAGLL